MMAAESLLKILLELDQQCLTSRPSPWGLAAELVARMAAKVELSGYTGFSLGDWRSVDISAARKPASGTLDQPTLDAIRGMEVEPLELKTTDKGFLRANFPTATDNWCSLQESHDESGACYLMLGFLALDRKTVARLLPHLIRFAATGGLKGEEGNPK